MHFKYGGMVQERACILSTGSRFEYGVRACTLSTGGEPIPQVYDVKSPNEEKFPFIFFVDGIFYLRPHFKYTFSLLVRGENLNFKYRFSL